MKPMHVHSDPVFRLSSANGPETAAIPVDLLPGRMRRDVAQRHGVAAKMPGILAIVDRSGDVIAVGMVGADLAIDQRRAAGYAFGDVRGS